MTSLKLFLVFLICRMSSAIELDFTVEVMPATKDCFHQEIKKDVAVDVEYQVIDGGDLDVNFVIKNPGGQVMVTDVRKTENYHKFTAPMDGDYEFCIDNSFSRFSDKVVFFELLTDEEDEEMKFDMDYDMESNYEMKIEDFRDYVFAISHRIDKAEAYFKLFKANEMRDSNLLEGSFQRVNLWSAVHLAVMICTALIQVFMIRRLFYTDDSKKARLEMRT